MTFVPGIVPPADPARRAWFLVHPKGLVVRRQGDRVTLPGDDDARALGVDATSAQYLGKLDDACAFAAPVAGGWIDEPFALLGLREAFGALGEEAFWVAGRANQLIDWAATHAFCGRCAVPTTRVEGERALRCPACKLSAYPRITPAVIVLVRRGAEALLARGARFPLPFFSALAGFSEVGESLEETLAREVREEVGLEVQGARYFGSQPWPFPHSLMVGFTAEWAAGEIRVDPSEILEAGWFRADALPVIPPPLSIARRLIDAWVAEVG